MRDDMHKVIVERPRLRRGRKQSDCSRDGRIFRNRVHDDEDGGFAPHRLGMKAGYDRRRCLNENLAPLGRWLEKQAHRHWDDVYSELCAGIDRRNTVQQHIFTHIEDFVVLETRLVEGRVLGLWRWPRSYLPIGELVQDLFVHPLTRILLPNREGIEEKRRAAAARRRKEAEAAVDRKILGEREQLHRIGGEWYAIRLEKVPPFGRCWDVLLRDYVSLEHGLVGSALAAWGFYGKPGWYAVSKRQLNAKELRRYGLREKAGASRPFLLGLYNRLMRCSRATSVEVEQQVKPLNIRMY